MKKFIKPLILTCLATMLAGFCLVSCSPSTGSNEPTPETTPDPTPEEPTPEPVVEKNHIVITKTGLGVIIIADKNYMIADFSSIIVKNEKGEALSMLAVADTDKKIFEITGPTEGSIYVSADGKEFSDKNKEGTVKQDASKYAIKTIADGATSYIYKFAYDGKNYLSYSEISEDDEIKFDTDIEIKPSSDKLFENDGTELPEENKNLGKVTLGDKEYTLISVPDFAG